MDDKELQALRRLQQEYRDLAADLLLLAAHYAKCGPRCFPGCKDQHKLAKRMFDKHSPM